MAGMILSKRLIFKTAYMENIKILNTFRCARSAQSSFNDQIARMTDLVLAYNFSDQRLTLYFFGDQRSGVRYRIECEEPETKARLVYVLRQYAQRFELVQV
jgi:hypothetical protein